MGAQKTRKKINIRLLLAIVTALLMTAAFAGCGLGDGSGIGGGSGSEDYAYTPEPEDYAYTEDGIGYINNVILVYFEDGVSDSEKEEIVDQADGKVIGQIDTLNQYQIQVETKSYEELRNLCASIEASEAVTMAVVDYTMETDIMETYTMVYYPGEGYSDDWNEESPNGQNWGQEAVHAPQAWAYRTKLSPVNVAVVDNGFDTGHEDLQQNLSIASGQDSSNTAMDHGTEVAGIIGADFDNDKGISGIAPNASVKGYPLGTGNNGSVTTSTTTASVVNAVKDGAKVVNLSRGSSSLLKYNGDQNAFDAWGKTASLEVSRLMDQGYDFLIVQSAGNGNHSGVGVDARFNNMFCSITEQNCYTDKHSYAEIIGHVIVVGNAYYNGSGFMQAASSNGGDRVTICAPGQGIYSTSVGGYNTASGTSLAAPFVSGTAAMVWGANPSLKASDVKEILVSTCNGYALDDPDSKDAVGAFGMLDAGAAVAKAAGSAPTESEPTSSAASTGQDAFVAYLKNIYDKADDYANGYPYYYEREADGTPKPEYGATTWFKYAVADFDGDGESEMIVYNNTYVADSSSPGVDGSVGGYHFFENTPSDGVKEVTGFTVLGSFAEGKITCYDNGLIDIERSTQGGGSYMIVIGFGDSFKSLLGSFADFSGEYLSYEFGQEGGSVNRNICSGFAVDDQKVLSSEEYRNEYEQTHTGRVINVRFLDINESNLH